MVAHAPIPEQAFREAVAVLGRTGSGKTFAAKGAVELMLERGDRVCIIDPTGVWYGLKSSADGTAAGFPVAIFGGVHADVPLAEDSGAALAELLATRNLPAVIDVSEFTRAGQTRFMTKFLDELYSKNRQPLTIVFDEADLFAPQRAMPEQTLMLNRMEQIVRRGRVRGFKPWMITQRPAELHKSVLSQAATLIAMKLPAPQDRDAVGAWIEGQADRDEGKRILAALPKLANGEGFVWCPAAEYLERVTFPPIRTFDSGKTPEHGEAPQEPARLADVDLSGVLEALQPKEPALKGKAKPERDAVDWQAMKDAAYAQGKRAGYIEGMRAVGRKTVERIKALAVDLARDIEDPESVPAQVVDAAPRAISYMPSAPSVSAKPRSNGAAHGAHLPEGERTILLALAQHRASGCSREQLSVLTAYKRSSRDKYVQRLKQAGFAEVRGEFIFATQAGVAALGSDYQPLPTGKALREHWLARLPAGEALLLELVASKYPHATDREWLSQKSELKRSSRDKYLQRLSARKLVTVTGRGELRASDDLFDGAR